MAGFWNHSPPQTSRPSSAINIVIFNIYVQISFIKKLTWRSFWRASLTLLLPASFSFCCCLENHQISSESFQDQTCQKKSQLVSIINIWILAVHQKCQNNILLAEIPGDRRNLIPQLHLFPLKHLLLRMYMSDDHPHRHFQYYYHFLRVIMMKFKKWCPVLSNDCNLIIAEIRTSKLNFQSECLFWAW